MGHAAADEEEEVLIFQRRTQRLRMGPPGGHTAGDKEENLGHCGMEEEEEGDTR